ncbi:MAG: hypothetical protein WB821_10810 [Burkholderiaceae bacterium]
MKLNRLFQPRNPLFWIVMALHALTMVLAWMLHNRPLSIFGMLLIGGFALCNAVLGMWLTWRLVREDEVSNKAADQ